MNVGRAVVLIAAMSIALLGAIEEADAGPEKIELGLYGKLAVAEPTDTFRVWVYFADRPEIDPIPEDRLPPVDSTYVEEVSSVPGVTPRFVDELLNSLSVIATPSAIYEIVDLPFVSEIRLVPGGCVIPEGCYRRPPPGTGEVDVPLVGTASTLAVLAGAVALLVAIRVNRT